MLPIFKIMRRFYRPALFAIMVGLLAAAPAAAQERQDRWLESDKAVHVLASYLAAGGGFAIAIERDAPAPDRRRAAILAAALAGLGKEAFDVAVQRERWSWKDLAADAAGLALWLGLTLIAGG